MSPGGAAPVPEERSGTALFNVNSVGATTFEQTISGLVGGSAYEFRVYASNKSTTPLASDELDITIEYQNSSGGNVGTQSLVSGLIPSSSSYQLVQRTTNAPSGATQAVLTVSMSDVANDFTDVYLDDFYLTGPTSSFVEHFVNAGVEDRGVSGWSPSESGGSDDLLPFSGNESFINLTPVEGSHFVGGNVDGDPQATMTQTVFGISPGTTYDFSMQVANDFTVSSTDNVDFELQWKDASGSVIGTAASQTGLTGNSDKMWRQISEAGLVAPNNAAQLTVTITFNNTDGTFIDVFVDDLSLFDATASAAVPSVTTTSASSITPNSAVLGGDVTADGGATITDRGVVYSATDTDPFIGDSGVTQYPNGSGTGAYSETISGLSANMTYSVRAYAINSEGTSYGSVQTFTTDNTAPVFTQTTSNASFAENGTGIVFDFNANDGDGGPDDTSVSYALGGTGAGDFTINASGELTFASAPDFENPTDANGNNEYLVDVTAEDGEASNNTTTQTITIAVTDVNDNAPAFAALPTTVSVPEDAAGGTPAFDADATDADGTSPNNTIAIFSITSGNTDSDFSIDATTGEITVNGGLSQAPGTDYTLGITATDGGSPSQDATETLTVSVTDVNSAPTVALAPTNASIAEGTTTPVAVSTITITDDGTGTNNLSLTGTDAASFDLDGSDLRLIGTADFETQASYDVTVEVDDAALGSGPEDSASFTLSITDATEAPVATTDAVSGVTPTEATLNGMVGTGGGPDATITFDYYVTADGAGTATNVAATPGTVTAESGEAVTADLTGLTANTEHTFEVIATSDEGTTRGGTLTFTTAGVPEADVFAETTPSRTAIPDGGSYDYGSVDLGATVSQTFTVENNGSTDLVITNVAGTESSDFQLVSTPSSPTIAPGDQVQLEVSFTPSGIGARSFTLTVDNNDPDENPYNLTLQGVGQAIPASATTDAASSVTESGATLNGTVNPEGVSTTVSFDYYVTSDGPGTVTTVTADESPVTGTTDQNVSASLTGLIPDTEYTFEVVTTNDGGTARGGTQTFTTTPADLAITDGSSAGLDLTAQVSAGTVSNVVGIFALSASSAGTTFDAVSITNDNPGVPDISAARLFASADQTLDVRSDTELAEVSVDNTNAPATLTFSGFSEAVSTSVTYVILAIDVDAGAAPSDVQFFLDAPSDLTLSGAQVTSVNGQSQSTFSDLLLSNAAATLPVEMAGFDATPSDGQVELQWTTLSETNNAGFNVQRQIDENRGWEVLDRVVGAGTTTERQTYRFTDKGLPYEASSVEYRLQQVDVDGTESFTEPVALELAGVDRIELLGTTPNPARSHAAVRFAVPADAEDARLVLFDLLGRQVRSLAVTGSGRQKATLDTDGLATGTYFLRLTAGGQSRTTKLTVVR